MLDEESIQELDRDVAEQFFIHNRSMYLLYKATQTLPMGTAYAVWTGIGAVGTVLIGIFVFNEPTSFWRVFFIFTLIASIVGLKFVSKL
jgi:quaternary ammonium compound-resistance protein SugE